MKKRNKDFNKFFLELANKVGEMSTCDRGNVGCILVKDRQILSTGYAGSPSGLPHCDKVGHLMKDGHCIRTVHAEQNAIIQAAKHGVSIEGSIAYVSMVPCFNCTKMLINAGIKEIFAANNYKDTILTCRFLKEAGIKLTIVNKSLRY